MTIEITVAKISANEIRVTLTSDIRIRISGNLSVLARREGTNLPVGSASGKAPAGTHAPELLTVEQAAEVLHISRDRVYHLIRSGQLRSIKIGKLRRIAREWIEEFVGQQEIPQNQTR